MSENSGVLMKTLVFRVNFDSPLLILLFILLFTLVLHSLPFAIVGVFMRLLIFMAKFGVGEDSIEFELLKSRGFIGERLVLE